MGMLEKVQALLTLTGQAGGGGGTVIIQGSNDGCVYDVVSVTDSALEIDSHKTVYKHAPTTDATYTFVTPAEGNGKVVVFWLWITLGDTAPVLTFPSSVTWQNEPTLAANSETMLAFMSIDNGATWQANVQWEK